MGTVEEFVKERSPLQRRLFIKPQTTWLGVKLNSERHVSLPQQHRNPKTPIHCVDPVHCCLNSPTHSPHPKRTEKEQTTSTNYIQQSIPPNPRQDLRKKPLHASKTQTRTHNLEATHTDTHTHIRIKTTPQQNAENVATDQNRKEIKADYANHWRRAQQTESARGNEPREGK